MWHTKIIPSKPVLVLEDKKKEIVISDIHIGFENSMASNEIFIGKNSSIDETINEVTEIIESEKPDSLILLGDVKSSIKTISRNEWDEVPRFFKEIGEKCDVTLIPGNHDANIQRLVPENISMISTVGMVQENTLFTHGHAMPTSSFSHIDKIVMGHLHPVFFQEDSVVNGQRVWVSIKTDKKCLFSDRSGELEIIIVPSFNRYFYATQRRKYKKSISPIIEKIGPISAAKIITLDGTIIGDESIIDQVI